MMLIGAQKGVLDTTVREVGVSSRVGVRLGRGKGRPDPDGAIAATVKSKVRYAG